MFYNPAVAADLVPLTLIDGVLCVGLIHRDDMDAYALPGVYLGQNERFMDAVVRAAAKGDLDLDTTVHPLPTYFDDPGRDERGIRTISIPHVSVVTTDNTLEWTPVDDVMDGGLAFDHSKILTKAVSWITDLNRIYLLFTKDYPMTVPRVRNILNQTGQIPIPSLSRTLNQIYVKSGETVHGGKGAPSDALVVK